MRLDPKLWKKVRSILYVSSSGFGLFAGFSYYNGNEQFYNGIAMPVLQLLDPETSHRLAVIAAKYNLLPRNKYNDPQPLSTELWGIKFSNPLGLAAGFDKDGEAVKSLLDLGFGFVEIGSVTPLPQPGNDKPRVFRLKDHLAIINRYGFNSLGHDAVVEHLKSFKENPSFSGIVGVNLGKNKTSEDPINDYVLGIERFSPYAHYLVINVSSPNTPGLRSWQQKEQLESLLRAVVEARNRQPDRRPLLLKLAPDLSDQERRDIADVISKPQCRVDGLVISNTTLQRPGLDGLAVAAEAGGLSGAPLCAASTQLISDMYRLTEGKVPIVGVGGVLTGQDAFEKISAGASLVQLYTALTYFGPPRIKRVKEELDKCLKENGYSSISEAVGSLHKKSAR